ncbi:MAG: LutC/YkgG family protein [Desulfatiglandales bacterium]
MRNEQQEGFIANVRKALGRGPVDERRPHQDLFPEKPGPEILERLEIIGSRTREERLHLLDRLMAEAVPLNLKVFPVETAEEAGETIATLISEKEPEWGGRKQVVAWEHPLIQGLGIEDRLRALDVPLYITSRDRRAEIRRLVTGSYIGITSADYCVAATGTLVMKTRPGHARSVSLVPSIHVAVIELLQIVADLKELYTLLAWDPRERAEGLTNCLTFISGPSKTGDIELVMVHGAHGPRELYLIVITGEH